MYYSQSALQMVPEAEEGTSIRPGDESVLATFRTGIEPSLCPL
jgi:hypothetical protein